MYRALNLNKKGDDRKMAYALVDEGAVTLGDLSPAAFSEMTSLPKWNHPAGPGQAKVRFNENIGYVERDDIKYMKIPRLVLNWK